MSEIFKDRKGRDWILLLQLHKLTSKCIRSFYGIYSVSSKFSFECMFSFPQTLELMQYWWRKGVRCKLLGVNEIQELFTCLGIIPEDTKHGGSHSFAVDFLNTSHDHAHVPETQFSVNCLKKKCNMLISVKFIYYL